jgi:protein gp37
MVTETSISWCDFTSNPLRYRDAAGKDVWACVKTSSGCSHCYSEALAKRWDRGQAFTRENMEGLTPFIDQKEIRALLTSKKIIGKKVFLGDMTDLFGEWVPFELIDEIFAAMALRPDVTFMVLTKRAERMREYFLNRKGAKNAKNSVLDNMIQVLANAHPVDIKKRFDYRMPSETEWPLENMWLGVSCEDQKTAHERVPELLRCPAAVRFVSCEPLIGPIDLTSLPQEMMGTELEPINALLYDARRQIPKIDWVIIGGESGPLARPMQIEWAQSLADQCAAAGVALWMKQDSGARPGLRGQLPDDLWNTKQFPEVAHV